MKRLITFILVIASIFSCMLFQSCKKINNNAISDVENSAAEPGKYVQGGKVLYGKRLTTNNFGTVRTGDLFIEIFFGNLLGYYTMDDPKNGQIFCFDPTCTHGPQDESCNAVINAYLPTAGETEEYPISMFVDMYENASSPVIYIAYRRDDFYTVNDVPAEREPCYCIEKLDISVGKREVVADDIKYTIDQICSYDDCLYYVLDMGGSDGKMMYRLKKEGGKPEQLDRDENAIDLCILDATGDKLYYTVNNRYLYRCSLNLKGSEKVFDLGELKGSDGNKGVIAGMFYDYLYFFTDIEEVFFKEDQPMAVDYKGSCFRLPVNDLGGTPETVAQNIMYAPNYYAFTEGTFYYEPCVYRAVDKSEQEGYCMPFSLSDGVLMAYDMVSGEHRTVAEKTGLDINIRYAWNDIVFISGWPYDATGVKLSNSDTNLILAYSNGDEYRVWNKGDINAIGYLDPSVYDDDYYGE